MSATIAAILVLLSLIALAQMWLVYRAVSRHALDPLGHDAQIEVLNKRVLKLEMRQSDLMLAQAATEQRLFDRLGEMQDAQSKMHGHMTAIESMVSSEQKERREMTTRMDSIMSAVSNIGRRFGGIEAALQGVLDARPAQKLI